MSGQLASFVPIFVFVVILLGFVITNLVLAHILGPRNNTPVKQMPYESGMDPIGDARQPFDVKFYLVAILFLVFDVELLFLYPWAVSAYVDQPNHWAGSPMEHPNVATHLGQASPGIPAELRGTVFGVMLVFIATLAIAYVYAWRKGVFKWR